MKKSTPFIIGILISITAAIIAYIWLTNLNDSVYAYRSPLHNSPPSPGKALGIANTRTFVIVLIDGLRYDTSMNTEVMPFLNQLRKGGAVALMHSQTPSYSQPGYTTILTGAWPDINDGPTLNLPLEDIPTITQDNIFSAAKRDGMLTAVSAYDWFDKLIPHYSVTKSFYTSGDDQVADGQVTNAALPWLSNGMYQLVLIHLDQVDYAGHYQGGPQDPRWDAAANRADKLLEQIATSMDLSKDTLLVISDHGHIDTGGHGGQDPIVLLEPFVLAGKGVIPADYGDVQMVDVAPTVAAILGTSIPATSQGHPLIAMYNFTLEQVSEIRSTLATQQELLAVAYGDAIGHKVSVTPAEDIVTATQTAMSTARETVLNAQRLPRGIITFIALFMMLMLAGWHARTNYSWMLIGMIAYILTFNIKYVLIDHKTYSLSSVTDATSLLANTALTTLLALFVGWLVVVLGTKLYQMKPLKAADLTLKFTLVGLTYLFIPPMLHYFIDGATVTWTLPNFLVSFLAYLFLIQVMVAAVVGLFLTGISPLLAYFGRGK